jgi:hypothetical protein
MACLLMEDRVLLLDMLLLSSHSSTMGMHHLFFTMGMDA